MPASKLSSINLALLVQFNTLIRITSIDLGLVIYLNLGNILLLAAVLHLRFRVDLKSSICISIPCTLFFLFLAVSATYFVSSPYHLKNVYNTNADAVGSPSAVSFMFYSCYICRLLLFIIHSIFLLIKFYMWDVCAIELPMIKHIRYLAITK